MDTIMKRIEDAMEFQVRLRRRIGQSPNLGRYLALLLPTQVDASTNPMPHLLQIDLQSILNWQLKSQL
ncbi:hypothetical protein L2E82_35707 [Cichorium intybus]|uniref:Uncharacterized protein n=1 Tax=Cichorium intybus TaxID=13427 RepID=A0ACB9BPL0_CICIN|nr:hypothetical protein L2E82_35707 [Cichorium intybus]